MLSNRTNIVIRQGSVLDSKIDLSDLATIEGSLSGRHEYDALISDDRKTLVINPRRPFSPGESVGVSLKSGLRTIDDNLIGGLEWTFRVSPKIENFPAFEKPPARLENREPEIIWNDSGDDKFGKIALNGVSIPADFPDRTVLAENGPDSGYIFLSNFYGTDHQYIMILDNSGNPIFYQRVHENTFDFKKQPNGMLTYYTYYTYHFYVMDSTYTVIDSIQCGNGYELGTDPHELQILDDGHALLMAHDSQQMDMSQIVECGRTDAIVTGLIIQELDRSKNVVWQWRSWDHFEITDATWDINLCGPIIDYVHGNSLELDGDGNLLLSSRNLDEVTKIDRNTGEIIWRWGGENNEFTFVNDATGFSHQHDARRLHNGNVTLYDNGNLNVVHVSRAVEYRLDEINKIAFLEWEYRQSPDVSAGVMGNTQRLAGGNTVIGWGAASPNVTEVSGDGVKAFEMSFDPNVISYRAFRFPWHGVAAKPYLIAEVLPFGVRLLFNKFGDAGIEKYYVYMDTLENPTVLFDSSYTTAIEISDVFNKTYYFRVTAVDRWGRESDFSNELELSFLFRYYYLTGDANMFNREWPPEVIGSDVTFLANFFRQNSHSPACLIDGFYAAADVNGDCQVIGSDVTRIVDYFRGGELLYYCPHYPPEWLISNQVPEEPPETWPGCEEGYRDGGF